MCVLLLLSTLLLVHPRPCGTASLRRRACSVTSPEAYAFIAHQVYERAGSNDLDIHTNAEQAWAVFKARGMSVVPSEDAPEEWGRTMVTRLLGGGSGVVRTLVCTQV